MKKVIHCLLLAALCLISFGGCQKKSKINVVDYDPAQYTETIDYSRYSCVFCDEFEGELNRNVWGDTRQGYRRDGYWDSKLAFTDGEGHLIVRTELRGEDVYSGAVRTKDKYLHGFGYYEMCCKFPSQTGLWHAFWMMCGDVYSEENGSADGVEIDIFEYLPGRDAVNVALHWDGYDEAHKNVHQRFDKTGFGNGEYHVFGMNWDEDGYAFYIDGKKVWTTTGGGVCQPDGYMKISTEYGDWGDWVGTLDKSTLPVDWVIDYVKVYDKVA